MAVYPTNDPALVNTIGKLLAVDLDRAFTLTNVDGQLCFASTTNM